MRFADILGHEAVIARLQGEIARDRMAHVYLFWGPDGVGKKTTALAMAQTLLCSDPVTAEGGSLPDACGKCKACHLVEAETHPDLHVVVKEMIRLYKPESKSKATTFSIDLVREAVIAKAGRRPMLADHRVFILDEAHLLGREAANALLKVLEEPPPACRLILIAPTIEGFLPTVLSRVRQVPFSTLPRRIVSDHLRERTEIGDEAASVIAAMTEGSIGASLAWLADGVLEIRGELLGKLEALSKDNDLATADQFVVMVRNLAEKWRQQTPETGKAEAARRAGMRLIALITWHYRDLLVLAGGGRDELVANRDLLDDLKIAAARTTVANLQRQLLALAQADQRLALNANLDLTFQALTTQLANPTAVADDSRPLKRAILA